MWQNLIIFYYVQLTKLDKCSRRNFFFGSCSGFYAVNLKFITMHRRSELWLFVNKWNQEFGWFMFQWERKNKYKIIACCSYSCIKLIYIYLRLLISCETNFQGENTHTTGIWFILDVWKNKLHLIFLHVSVCACLFRRFKRSMKTHYK